MKKIMLGIIIGVLLAISVPVAAEGVMKKVTATIRSDFSIELNGKSVTLKNSPLAYDGNSYLPVREIASLLGTDVDFKDGVIKLDTPGESPEALLGEINKAIEIENKNIALFENALKDMNAGVREATPEQIAETENLLKLTKESLARIEKRKTELIEKYPELTK